MLRPVLPRIGMLTIQAAGTASRSNSAQGTFAHEAVQSYMTPLRERYDGTLQIQGGVKTQTIGEVVKLGAEFLVCGTEIFRHPDGHTPPEVVNGMLRQAATALAGADTRTEP
jgi:pentose-5-phosphate-3-epimerase